MTILNRPNLFSIGAKELHQDAFLAWLIAWGDPSHKVHDSRMHQCGMNFINYLISLIYSQNSGVIESVIAGRQWRGVDVWAEIRTTEENFLIILEDKLYAGEHEGQLNKYHALSEQYCMEKQLKPVFVYLKSTSDSEFNFRKIRDKGFSIVTRKNLLSFLEVYDDISNHIYRDFADWLRGHEQQYSAFKTLPPSQWDGMCWQGFYEDVESLMQIVGWHFVNRISGDGFWNLCLNWEDWDGFPVYLQIEQGPLCFKIATGANEIDFEGEFSRTQKRNEWHQIILAKAKDCGMLEIKRPARFGNGDYMTVAYVEKDSWLGEPENIISMPEVIRQLTKYIEFLRNCLS